MSMERSLSALLLSDFFETVSFSELMGMANNRE